MPLISKPSAAAFTSLSYITIGALMDVWSGIWYRYLSTHPPAFDTTWYWCYGFMLTGAVLIVIGLTLGRIGREARHAELPPPEATHAEAHIDQTAAARAPMVAPANPAVPTFAMNQPGVPPTQNFPTAIPATGVPYVSAPQVPPASPQRN